MADRTNHLRRDDHIDEEKEPSFRDYFSLPRLIFFGIVVGYLLFGASTLHILERGNIDDDINHAEETKVTIQKPKTPIKPTQSPTDCRDLNKVVEQMWDDAQNEDISEEEWKRKVKETIERIDEDDDDEKPKTTKGNDDDDDDDDDMSWTFAQSFLYTTATVTRIGSTVQPTSFFGRIFVLIYTFFGIPLLLIFFADLGKIFVNLLQSVVERAQKSLNLDMLPSLSDDQGDINVIGFIVAVSAVLGAYVVGMSFLFRIWCGGSIFGNVYTAFLIAFGVGPAPIGGTETCYNAGIFSILPSILLVSTAPIAWSLTNMQTDLMGTEYIQKLHVILRSIRREKMA